MMQVNAGFTVDERRSGGDAGETRREEVSARVGEAYGVS